MNVSEIALFRPITNASTNPISLKKRTFFKSKNPLPCMPPAMHAPLPCMSPLPHMPPPMHTPCNAWPPAMHAPCHAHPLPCTALAMHIPCHAWPLCHVCPCHACPLHVPLPVNRITDACENITLQQLRYGR